MDPPHIYEVKYLFPKRKSCDNNSSEENMKHLDFFFLLTYLKSDYVYHIELDEINPKNESFF